MAYAALEEERFRSAPRRPCGFAVCPDAENLANQGTDVGKVVAFLEAKYDQDPLVIQTAGSQPWQVDKSNALTVGKLAEKNCQGRARAKKTCLDSPTTVVEDALGANFSRPKSRWTMSRDDCEPEQFEGTTPRLPSTLQCSKSSRAEEKTRWQHGKHL